MLEARGKSRGRRSGLVGLVPCLLIATLSGCGAIEKGTTATEDDTASSASPSTETSADAGTLIRRALEQWQKADTGAFTQTAEIPGGGTLTERGVYQLSTRSSKVTKVVETLDEEPIELRFIGVRDVSFVNSQEWQNGLDKCWMRFAASDIEEATGMAAMAGAGGLAGNLIALSYAEGTRVDPDDPDVVVGTVDMTSAASMFGPGILKVLRDPSMEAPVEAEFRLVEGEIRSWRISGQSMAEALERERALKVSELGSSADVRAAISAYDVEVKYERLGMDEVNVRPPAPELQMTGAQSESGEGCPAAR